MQDVPSGEPSVLPPIVDRIEVNRLMDDIPKFKQWISTSSSAIWDVFLEHELDDLLPTHASPWMMQTIFDSVEQRAAESPSPTEPQPEVDPSLMSMVEASLNPPCRVSTHAVSWFLGYIYHAIRFLFLGQKKSGSIPF